MGKWKVKFITILGEMIYNLKLTGNELLLYALIYRFTQDWKSTYHWSLSYIQEALNISRHTAIDTLKKLQTKWLIIKTSESHYMVGAESSLPASEEVAPVSSEESAPLASAETSPNIYNTINNTINNNILPLAEKNNIAKDIFDYYISKTDIPSKYHYPAKTKLDLVKLLDKYNKEQLIAAADNYFKVTEKKWRKSPRYFYAASQRSESYMMFEWFISNEEKKDIKKNIDIGF